MLLLVQCGDEKKLEEVLKEVLPEITSCLNKEFEIVQTSKPVEVAGGVVRGDFGLMIVEGEFLFGDVRVFLGRRCEGLESDVIFVVETKVDDASGEVIANAVERVMEKAIDVEVVSVLGKKGRPSILLRALSKPERVGEVAEVVMRETGSTGVRIYRVFRLKSPRKTVKVKVEGKYEVRVKVSGVNVKPEFEDVKAIAEKEGIPLPEAYRIVYRHVLSELAGESPADETL